MKTWIGIDPGAKGAIATINEAGEIEIRPLENEILIERLAELAANSSELICCIEKVNAMPGQGVTSMFTFGKGYGFVLGALTAFGIPYQEISPKTWKAEFGCNLGKGASPMEKKRKDIEAAKKLFPHVSLLRSALCKVDSDGYADALLMAKYAQRRL